MVLSDLHTGQTGVIIKVSGHGGFRRRILEMGFVRGKKVTVVLNAPLKDPIKYRILDYEVSLRRSEAAMIEVLTEEEAHMPLGEYGSSDDATAGTPDRDVFTDRINEINIALVGNPNSGKTSLFNALSGGHEHVGNYSGVTVDAKSGHFRYNGYRFNITDLPGTYALSAYTPEELFVRNHLLENNPDIIINTVVASNLERNLFLTTELIDINPRMVVALNMYDELSESGAVLDYQYLGRMLGVPMVPIVARSGKGTDNLLDTVIDVYENRCSVARHIHINYSPAVETEIAALSRTLREDGSDLPRNFPPRYWAMKLLEGDRQIVRLIRERHPEQYPKWEGLRDAAAARVKKQLQEDPETAMTSEKYGFISGALKETFTPSGKEQNRNTAFIDAIVTHKLFSFPIFLFLIWIMFNATFTLGAYPQQWIESLVGCIGGLAGRAMSDGPLKDLLVNGIIGGAGSVVVFLPNILILYLFISLMEDSGYMARAAFIMDKLMHKIGLHGKSFIPLIMGFGCNVPAIISSRTIESRSSRIITILINPFMSCSARLPVYILMAGTFFPRNSALALMLLYLLGILAAIFTARMMRRFIFKTDETPFVMELPPYRVPTLHATLRHMWDKGAQYLRKIGSIILLASIFIWFLSYYPRPDAGTVGTDGMIGTAGPDEVSVTSVALVAPGTEPALTAHADPADSTGPTSPTSPATQAVPTIPADPAALATPAGSAGSAVPADTDPADISATGTNATATDPADTAPGIRTAETAPAAVPATVPVAAHSVATTPVAATSAPDTAPAGSSLAAAPAQGPLSARPRTATYLERIGRFCEPIMKPLGLNWKAGVALISGAAAKEIIVSTLGVLTFREDTRNSAPGAPADTADGVSPGTPADADSIPSGTSAGPAGPVSSGTPADAANGILSGNPAGSTSASSEALLSKRLLRSGDFTGCSAVAFMVFVLLYFPCIATLGAIAHETGSWKWAVASLVYNTTVAWIAAFVIYRICLLF